MELIKLNFKHSSEAGSYYTCELTDKLNEIVGMNDKFLICNKTFQYIYRIQYNNISIGDLLCITDNRNSCNIVTKFTPYISNLDFINPKIPNNIINQVYRYLKSLEGNIYFNR